MMYKKYLLIISAIIIALNINTSVSQGLPKLKSNTLIIYEREKIFSSNENIINYLELTLNKFSKSISKININDYTKGYLNNFDYIFVANIQNDIKNQAIIEDLDNYHKKIYWVGDGIKELLDNSSLYNFSYIGKNNNIYKVIYKDRFLPVLSSEDFNIVKINDNQNKKTKIKSTISDGYNEYPYVLQDKNLYYLSNYNKEVSYIFEDTLNDFYGVTEFESNKIFLQVSDINEHSDVQKLKDIANYLYEENEPYVIRLNLNSVNTDKNLIETIRYMQEKGGSVVLNGFSQVNPVCIGFANNEDEIKDLKDNFYKISMIRGYTGYVEFNSSSDIEYLKEVVEFFDNQEVDFDDLRNIDNEVIIKDIELEVKPINKNKTYSTLEKAMKSLNKIIVIFITIIIILFSIILLYFKRLNNKKFKRRL